VSISHTFGGLSLSMLTSQIDYKYP